MDMYLGDMYAWIGVWDMYIDIHMLTHIHTDGCDVLRSGIYTLRWMNERVKYKNMLCTWT
jgi:hypothetical protein